MWVLKKQTSGIWPPRWLVLQTEKSNKYLKLSFVFHFQNYTYFLFYIINDQNLFSVPSYHIVPYSDW